MEKKNVVMFRNVENAEGLFHKIDSCKEPITISIPSGESEDLRDNRALQETIVKVSGNNVIPKLDLNCRNSEDWVDLMQYMIAGD
ncbi:MAG: hypothetical protein ACOX6J_06815 [Oscillospiraceae bacterium]|jgi:S-methylmethionine-dependent homocysteine/selenocysteine methylase